MLWGRAEPSWDAQGPVPAPGPALPPSSWSQPLAPSPSPSPLGVAKSS